MNNINKPIFSSKGCKPQSSNCIVWGGPDIPCLDLCKGDNITKVVYELASEFCNFYDSLLPENLDLTCIDIEGCEPETFKELFQWLLCKVGELNIENTLFVLNGQEIVTSDLSLNALSNELEGNTFGVWYSLADIAQSVSYGGEGYDFSHLAFKADETCKYKIHLHIDFEDQDGNLETTVSYGINGNDPTYSLSSINSSFEGVTFTTPSGYSQNSHVFIADLEEDDDLKIAFKNGGGGDVWLRGTQIIIEKLK